MAAKDKKLEMFKDLIQQALRDEQVPEYETPDGAVLKVELADIQKDMVSRYARSEDGFDKLIEEAFEKGWSAAMDRAWVEVEAVHRRYNEK